MAIQTAEEVQQAVPAATDRTGGAARPDAALLYG